MLTFLSQIFKRPLKAAKRDLNSLQVGDFVDLIFRDPRKMGLVDPSNQLTKRYDPEDLGTRVLVGTITNLFVQNGMRFFELGTVKVVQGQRRERVYTLMEDDIEQIKVLKYAQRQ